jgi:hypothetical protein
VRTDVPPEDRDGRVFVSAASADVAETSWPYGSRSEAGITSGLVDAQPVPLVAYQGWANRGPSTMRVWMPVAD